MLNAIFQCLRQLDSRTAKAYFLTTPSRSEKLIASLGHTSFCVLVLAVTEACVITFGGKNGVHVALINAVSIGFTFVVGQATKFPTLRLRPYDDLTTLSGYRSSVSDESKNHRGPRQTLLSGQPRYEATHIFCALMQGHRKKQDRFEETSGAQREHYLG